MIGEEFELEAIRAVIAADGDPDLERRASARTELMAMVGHEVSMADCVSEKEPKARRRLATSPWGIGAFSGVAAVAVAVALVLGHGGAAQPASAVAALLDRAANSTYLVDPVHLRPGQVWYVEQVWVEGNSTAGCKTNCYETRLVRWWVGPRRYSMHTYLLSRSATRPTITQAPPNVPMKAAPFSARWSGVGGGYDLPFHYKPMLTVSTRPSSLRSMLLHPRGVRNVPHNPPRWEREQLIFNGIDTILLEPRVPARMLSALYRLLATMPGATLKRQVTDTLGRPAIEVEYEMPLGPTVHRTKIRLALFLDPKSYALLDTIQIATSKKFGSYSDMAYLNHGLVHRIGGLPADPTNH